MVDTKQAEYAIAVQDVHKKFKIYYDKGRTLKERLLFRNRNRSEERWVLQGISFSVKKGEAIGLIGENGAGKSTMLKLMTRIIYPDQGTITMQGRVSSLIELGAGFHPDMSGRENIYTNASIFGLTRKEIDARLQDIIAFSELEEFIDNPVRTYSSGMYMRLAFAVAINVDADILLIDEILAVGDVNFQTKCFDHLRKLKEKGITIVIVTHDLNTIERFCDRAIWFESGKVMLEASAARAVDAYLNFMNQKKLESLAAEGVNNNYDRRSTDGDANASEKAKNTENGDSTKSFAVEAVPEKAMIDYTVNHFGLKHIELKRIVLRNDEGSETSAFQSGKGFHLEMQYEIHGTLRECVFGMGFYTLEGQCIYGNNTQLDRLQIKTEKNTGKISFHITNLPLLSGEYVLNVAVVDGNGTPEDFYRDYCHFTVVSDDRSVGFFSISHQWENKFMEEL